ncbi:MAG TPA: aminotransferase class IV [Thermoanaerobaculia bacterium]|nr:aminotransferase class IV [Thermoanaerobaculia bacterium]
MSGPVYWNGRLVEAAEVRISPEDGGLLAGDGLFETLRVDGGRARDVPAHLDRLLAGLDRIGLALPENREGLADAIARVASSAPGPVGRLRLTVTRGAPGDGSVGAEPTRLIQAWRYHPPTAADLRDGVAVLLLAGPSAVAPGPLAGLKSLSYQAFRLALRRAEAAGCREALLSNQHGLLAEGARSNLVLVLGGRAVTPPIADGCLPGTVRRRLLEQSLLAERSLTPDDLAAAEEVLLLNSLVGVLPVGEVLVEGEEGWPVATGRFAALLREAWEEATAGL